MRVSGRGVTLGTRATGRFSWRSSLSSRAQLLSSADDDDDDDDDEELLKT